MLLRIRALCNQPKLGKISDPFLAILSLNLNVGILLQVDLGELFADAARVHVAAVHPREKSGYKSTATVMKATEDQIAHN